MTAKWKRRTAAAAAVLVAAWLLHAAVLRGLAAPLVVDQPPGDFDCICISSWSFGPDGGWCYDKVAQLQKERAARRILLIESWGRLESIGAAPSFAATSGRELESRGVPREAIAIVRSLPHSHRAAARSLASWLESEPRATVLLLCDEFHSALVRRALDRALAPADAARVRVGALRGRRVNAENWWTSRGGIRAFGIQWLLWLQSRLDEEELPPSAGVDDYQCEFLASLEERAP
jgi:hypothetical protein